MAAARQVFAREGGEASMEAIAREAGVGVGTLYRHFPKRIDVVEAIYRDDVDELVRTAEQAVAELEPWPAVSGFLRGFVRYAQAKRTLLNELRDAFEKNPDLKLGSRQRIEGAMDAVIERAQRAGVVRTDLDGGDLMQLVVPMCMSATLSPDQSDRLLSLILDGLREVTAPTTTQGAGSSQVVPGGVVHALPADLHEALISNATALDAWRDITPLARNEFICWVEDAKKEVTRARRIRRTQEELEDGRRRPCCWPGCKHRERTGR